MKRFFATVILALLFPLSALAAVTSTNSSVIFTCSGSQGPYPFSFPVVPDSTALQISETDLSGTVTILPSTAYSTTAVNNDYKNGGGVTITAGCPSGYTLTIKRITPQTQTDVFTNGMPTLYKTFENALDKLTLMEQDYVNETQGPIGPAGPANTITIGTVNSGTPAAANITGTPPLQYLNLTLPQGPTGPAGATGPAGQSWGAYPGNSVKTTDYTIQSGDANSTVQMSCNTAACILSFPTASTFFTSPVTITSFHVFSTGSYPVLLKLPSSTYWWNTPSGFNLNSVVMGPMTNVWTDGTYWYASPLDVPISPATYAISSGAGWVSTDIHTAVPYAAKRIWGYLALAGLSTLQVAPVSSGVGTQTASIASGLGQIAMDAPFSMPVLTPGTIWGQATTLNGNIVISGFGF
jgi:hypothetical protein